MLVRDIMSPYPAQIRMGADIRRAAEIISVSEVTHLMVLDHEDAFVGVLSEGDLIRAMLPRFEEVEESGGSLADAFRVFVDKGRELADRPVDPLVITDVVTVSTSDEVVKAAVAMLAKQIRRIPVVDNGKLVGTVSRADICRAVIYHS